MPVPKSVIKVNKQGVQYISNVDATKYTMRELERGALKDVAKYLRKIIKSVVPFKNGVLKSNIATWVKKYTKDGEIVLQVGVYNRIQSKKKGKIPVYHDHLLEFGTVKMQPHPYLTPSVMNNIDTIRNIESQYLAYLNNENPPLMNEEDEIDDE